MAYVKIKFDPEAFTETFWKIQPVTSRFLLVYGSSASGKSQAVAQRTIQKCLRKKRRVLYIRKVATTVKDSIFADVKKWVSNFGLTPFTRYTTKPADIYFKNKSEILFRGLDDPEKLKSISGIDEIVVEEGTELTIQDFYELNRRLRGGDEMQFTIMFNPTDVDSWIYKHFFEKGVANTTIVHVTYQDNKYNSEEDIQQLVDMQLYDENDYNIYALGKWGNLKTGSEFFPTFSEVRHVGEVPYLPHLPIHQSWDFNALPYQPLGLFQVAENVKRWQNPVTRHMFKVPTEGCNLIYVTQIRAFKEYSFKPPLNDTDNVCKAFDEDFKDYAPDVLLYGDASGKNNVPGQGDQNNFKNIKTQLAKYIGPGSDRVLKANPAVLRSRKFMNKLFAGMYPIEFVADEKNCPDLIKDLAKVQLTRGGMLKEIEHDPKNKNISWQKRGHYADLTRYFCVSLFYDLYKSNE